MAFRVGIGVGAGAVICIARGGRSAQLPVAQFAADKRTSHGGLAGVRPAEDFGLRVFGALQLTEGPRHGDDVHQRNPFFEFGIQHDSAGHMANRAISGFFEDGDQTREVQQHPHDHAANRQGNARPLKCLPSPNSENNDGGRRQNFGKIHGARK